MTRLNIAKTWESYASIIPSSAGEVQLRETKRAFYAGAAAMFQALQSGLDEGKDPTEDDITHVDGLLNELSEFLEEMQQFKA